MTTPKFFKLVNLTDEWTRFLNMRNPKVWFKLANHIDEWARVSLKEVEYVYDLKEEIKNKMTPKLDVFTPPSLILKATHNKDNPNEAIVLRNRDKLVSVLKHFKIEGLDVKNSFARNILLFVNAPSDEHQGKNRRKNFYVHAYNDKGELLEKSDKFTMRDNKEYIYFLRIMNARGLKRINDTSENPEIITSLEDIQHNEYYKISVPSVTLLSQKKTFYVQRYNDAGEPLKKFDKFIMRNNEEYINFLKIMNARGLERINDTSENLEIITSFQDIQRNEYYNISSPYDEHQGKNRKKTFYVQAYNNEGELLENFEKFTIRNNEEYKNFLKSMEAKGLECIHDTSNKRQVIISLEDIQHNEFYQINASYLTAIKKGVVWSKVEDMAMENETLLAVKNFLNEKFKLLVETFPNRIMYKKNKPIMEWGGILVCNNNVFLLESKHKMTDEHVNKLVNRLNEFSEKLKDTECLEFKKLLGKQYIGVACGSLFPEELRTQSMNKLGLIVVYPSGNRYKVEVPENLNIH
ncbi:hypothetical protein Glove_48g67 [Diversispora epigaea]|uniref:Uncharacterized protein n=1 Tax=Diversispora epigaea TaxID=1348612 RepID=A0A397JF71_9GLOM|nr:hypothetical protein Glove_48g67 [Diversispora epigaea]